MADDKIPKGRIRRSAKLGSAIGVAGDPLRGHQGRQRGALRGGPPTRSSRRGTSRRRRRWPRSLGEMKGAAMKIGQLASFIDTEFLPPEYAELYQEQLAEAAHLGAGDALGEGEQGARGGVRRRPARRAVRGDRARGLRRRVDRPGAPRDAARRARRWRSRSSTRASPRRSRRTCRTPGMIMRLAKALAPGLDAKAVAERAARARARGARLRVRGAEPADLRARLPRPPVHLRARRGHAAVAPARARSPSTSTASASRRSSELGPEASATASARSSSASASARSTTCSTSTPTPTPATTC